MRRNRTNDTGDERPLVECRRSMEGRIVTLPEDEQMRSQCIRLGLSVGATFTCIERLPGGTIVLQTNRQEIALGRDLARQIRIKLS